MKKMSALASALVVSFTALSSFASPVALCGEEKDDKDDDESVQLCGEEKDEKDDDESVVSRLCGEEKDEKDDDES
jgi:hypothetical protein